MGVEFEQAMVWALKIMQRRPSFALAGSLSLIAQRAIERRNVMDLDFVVMHKDFLEFKKDISIWDYPAIEKETYQCWKVTIDNGFYYNIFVFWDKKLVERTSIKYLGRTINVQDAAQILGWKKLWARDKDLEDLKFYDL